MWKSANCGMCKTMLKNLQVVNKKKFSTEMLCENEKYKGFVNCG